MTDEPAATLSTTIDGHEVIVDVSGLAGVEQTAQLVPVVVVAAVVAGLLARLARPDRRPFLLAALATGTIGAAVALLSAPVVVGRVAAWIPGLTARITAGSAVVGVAGFACGALLALVPLAFFTVRMRLALVVTVVALSAFVVGAGGIVSAQQQRRTFVKALQQAFPLPQLVFPGQPAPGVDPTRVVDAAPPTPPTPPPIVEAAPGALAQPTTPPRTSAPSSPQASPPASPMTSLADDELPEVQVGRTRALAPTTWWQLGVKQPVLFGALGEERVAFPATDVAAWNLLDVRAALTADAAGVHRVTAEARQGPVRVRAPVWFHAVEDRSPSFLPLVTGTSLRFQKSAGPPGTTAENARRPPRRAPPTKSRATRVLEPVVDVADVAVDIGDEVVEDGFRVVDVHVLDDGQTRTVRVVARDGVLRRVVGSGGDRRLGEVFAGPTCGLPFLAQPTCTCDDGGVAHCARVDTDTVGAVVRIGLLIATLGLSEVMGTCDGCGDGREVGLVRLR